MAATLAIETRALMRVFRHKRAVDGLDMRVPAGEIYGFVGRNGAGKSTTMKMLCGLSRSARARARRGDRLLLVGDLGAVC